MLISCIMPIANRRNLVPLAIHAYLSQDWPEKELIVIDDGEDVLEDVFTGITGVLYHRLNSRQRIGTKRNLACSLALGRLICHWDSDDWSEPRRLSEQSDRLLGSTADVTGYSSMLFWDADNSRASLYTGSLNYALGSSLMYRREYWEKNRFPQANIGEDTQFIQLAQTSSKIDAIVGEGKMVARIHSDNVSRRVPLDWPVVEASRIPSRFFDALARSAAS